MSYYMIRNKYLTFLGMGLLFMASACNDGYEKEPVEHLHLIMCSHELIQQGYNLDTF